MGFTMVLLAQDWGGATNLWMPRKQRIMMDHASWTSWMLVVFFRYWVFEITAFSHNRSTGYFCSEIQTTSPNPQIDPDSLC